MDPITAIGLISGIISFVDTAAKIIKLARVIYDSVEGSPEEMAARSEVSADMFLMSQLLARPSQAAVTPDPDEQSLVALAGRCAALSATIIEEVDSLKPKRPGSKTGVLRAALKMLRVEPKIKDLESQRQRCRDQLNIHILALSNRDIKTLMESLRQDGIKLTQIDGSMRQLRSALAEIEVQTLSEKALKQLGDILHIGQDVLDQIAQERILQGVKGGFEDMDYRYQAVDRPYGNTFEWVWNADGDGNSSPSVKIIQWMLSDSGIFHLCGKIGSGKSTLMKKLCDHVKTRAALQKWADANGERELVMANFFFYALGTDARQKSVLGLYRTLLHQILARSPGFTPHVFPDQWNKALSQPTLQTAISILDDEITTAFERLARYHDAFSVGKYCFALFVDGLDEYEETTSIDRREMVKLLTDLANNKTFKICVSSRPENPFLDLFDEGSRVYLHDLTKTDLIEYVEGKLQDVDSSDERQQLASAITSKAEGVFLWVVLVIQRIRSQVSNGARFPSLLREVESLPTELNRLFQRIVDMQEGLDRLMLSHTVSLIQDFNNARLWLSIFDVYFLEDYEADPHFAERAGFANEAREVASLQGTRVRAERRLRGFCRGLVTTSTCCCRLDFVHRSVMDFFSQHLHPEQADFIDSSFDSLEALSQLRAASTTRRFDLPQSTLQRGQLNTDSYSNLKSLQRFARSLGMILDRRHSRRLDTPPYSFLLCLETTLPLFSLGVTRDLDPDRLPCEYKDWPPLIIRGQVETGAAYSLRTLRILHVEGRPLWDMEHTNILSALRFSPILHKLHKGQSKYPNWMLENMSILPVTPSETWVLVVYSLIADMMTRTRAMATRVAANVDFLGRVFESSAISPSTETPLAFSLGIHLKFEAEFLYSSTCQQQLDLWQHVFLWWAFVVAANEDFHSTEARNKSYRRLTMGPVLETFIRNHADLGLTLNIRRADPYANILLREKSGKREGPENLNVPTGPTTNQTRGLFIMEMKTKAQGGGDKSIKLYGLVDFSRDATSPDDAVWPMRKACDLYRTRLEAGQEHPQLPGADKFMSVRDWIECSRLADKQKLLQLIDERQGNSEQELPE